LKIAVAGLGYVGLSNAILLAQHHHVTALDIIPEKVAMLNRGVSPLHDPEIEEYLSKNNIEYMTDSTNLENEYTRNVLRNEVFPILKNNVNSNVINNFYKTSNIVAEADEYFENLAIKFCEKLS